MFSSKSQAVGKRLENFCFTGNEAIVLQKAKDEVQSENRHL